jgi:hypothetical protein
MTILNPYSLVFKIQKYARRCFKLAFINNLSISFRKSKFTQFIVYKTTDDLLNINNYKSRLNHYRTVFGIYNSILNTKSGVAWFQNRIVEESSVWPISDLIIWEPKPIIAKKMQGNFNNLPDNGFYHFLIEDLPRYLDTVGLEFELTTIYGSKSQYIQDALNILSITKSEYINYPILCETLTISEKTLGGIFTHSDHKKLLRFAKNIKPKSINGKIFISRKNRFKDSEGRGIKYIDEIEILFAKNMFSIIYFEDLSLVEQISIVKNAQIIAGFHGAGLANIVWNTNNCKIIEISETNITSHFLHLASICNHKYIFVKASELINFSKKDFSDLIR